MCRLMKILLFALGALLVSAHYARAATTVQVVSTYPLGDVVTLGRNQNFHVHLHYETDAPVRIWVRPYFRGQAVQAGSNPSRTYPVGSGEALGWFFLFNPGAQVDEVRVTAGDGSVGGTPVVAVHPVRINAGDRPAEAQGTPEWVARLKALDAAAQKDDYDRMINAPVSGGERWMVGGFMLGMLTVGILGLVAPAWGFWRWRGGWRIAAAVPAGLMAFVVLRILVDTLVDATSHNLWPFEILMAGALSVIAMIALVVARRLTGAGRAA